MRASSHRNRKGSGARTTGLTLAALVSLAISAGTARAETYSFAGGQTTVLFSWDYAGLSRNFGRVVGADGTLDFDPKAPESAQVNVKLAPGQISTGTAALDRLLRSPDFFDAASNPAITFRSTAVRATGERTGEVTGELTMHGITRPLTLNVRWNFSGEHPLGLVNPSFTGKYVSGFSATAKLLRSDWDLGRGTPLISDEVEIIIESEVIRRP